MKSKVSLTKSTDHSDGVMGALRLLEKDLKEKLSNIDQVVIKINFVTTHTELATTPFKAVEAFVKFIRPFYKGEIVIAEEATGGDTKEGFEKYGFAKLACEVENTRLLDLADNETVEKKIVYPSGKLTLSLSKTLVEAPFLVSITRAKTHDAVAVTLGIKNVAVGAICGGWGSRSKVHQGKSIHNILTEISKIVYPDFVIVDGTVGMEGDGPSHGDPIDAGWLVSSFDALAADSVAAHLMGFKLEDIGYFNMIRDERLGLAYPVDKEDMKIVGDYDISKVTPFEPHDTFDSQRLWK